MSRLTVALKERAYFIHINAELLSDQALFKSILDSKEVMIVTNSTLAKLYLKPLQALLNDYRYDTVILPDGERYKTWASLNLIFDALIKEGFSRKVTLIALGGGVVGDITGFAAACYQRGVKFIQLPTTLLAQVDSSVGGKTAINHPLAKNMIGAFHQPSAVIIDINTLNSLPEREYVAGLAEVLKYGLIIDKSFFQWLIEKQAGILAKNTEDLIYMIERCCAIKADIVSQDETEEGIRAILNFGHTFAHAIEHIMGYGTLLHGEAVSIGMILALKLSHSLGLIDEKLIQLAQDFLNACRLPTKLPETCSTQKMLAAMARDKKKLGNTLRFIVLEACGRAVIRADIPISLIEKVLET